MADQRQLLDTNVLVFAHMPSSRHYEIAVSLVTAGLQGSQHYAVAEQNLLEWYSSITSHRIQADPLSIERAQGDLQRYAHSGLAVIRPTAETWSWLRQILVQAPPVRGKDIYDRYLAATALSNGIDTILTENTKDFAGVPGLTAINPFAQQL